MQIDEIHIVHFLSFDKFDWSNLDPRLNIIVGPNGVGKTNLFHALRTVKDVLRPNQKPQTYLWSQSTHRSSSTSSIKISLDMRLNSEREQNLLRTFLIAALCNDQSFQSAVIDLQSAGNTLPSDLEDEKERLALSLQENVHLEDIAWLFTGRLVLFYNGIGNWRSWYESCSLSPSFHLGLSSPSTKDDLLMNHFIQGLLSKQGVFANSSQLFLRGLASVTARGSLSMQVDRPLTVPLATHEALERLIGTTLDSNRPINARSIFSRLIEQALVFSDNIRGKPQYEFTFGDFDNQYIDLSSGEYLAHYLFRKKNGSIIDHQQYDVIEKTFFDLTGRHFDVGFDMLHPPIPNPSAGSVQSVSNTPNALLSIQISNEWGEIPLEFSGAGIAEALFLSALIASGDRQILLLDEPALTLHPTMQTTLLNQIRTYVKQNQCIFVTHSPSLINPDVITNVSRFFIFKGSTQRAALNTKDIDLQRLIRLKQELNKSTNSRALLFSRGVILVEGDTEVGALPVWFEKQFSYSFESKDIDVYCVGGDNGFSPLIEFLQQFKIPWSIICDGPVIGDRIASQTQSRVVRQLRDTGITELPDTTGKDFLQLRNELESYGVFTLAENIGDEFETLTIIQSHKEEAEEQIGKKSKVRRGRWIAMNYDCPSEVANLLERVMHHLKHSDKLLIKGS